MILDELCPLAQNVVNFFLATDDHALLVADHALENADQLRLQLRHPLGVELDLGFVMARDKVLDFVGWQIRERAAFFLVSASTDVIVVFDAMSPFAFGVDQPTAAQPAENGALEVVDVLRRSIA